MIVIIIYQNTIFQLRRILFWLNFGQVCYAVESGDELQLYQNRGSFNKRFQPPRILCRGSLRRGYLSMIRVIVSQNTIFQKTKASLF